MSVERVGNAELNIMIRNLDKRVSDVEEAIKILTDLKVSDMEIKQKLINIDDKLRTRDKLFLALLSPLVAGVISLVISILIKGE